MPRKVTKRQVSENAYLEEQIILAYQHFTMEELNVIASLWCGGDYEISSRQDRGVLPIAVTIAALISVDHPLLCRDNGDVVFSAMGCAEQCLLVMLERREIPVPLIRKVVHTPLCTTCVQPVDNSKLYTGGELKLAESVESV